MADATTIFIEELTQEAFIPFGDVLEAVGEPSAWINRGMCARHSDLADVEIVDGGRLGISIFEATAYQLPLRLEMLERHPLGSQAFLPATADPFLVFVAQDENGIPSRPRAFETLPGQGVNYHRGVWHGVLTPLVQARFFVVDRIGDGANLEEHWLDTAYNVCRPA